MKVRITRPVQTHLEGSGLFVNFPQMRADFGWFDSRDPAGEAAAHSLATRIEESRARADGSVTVDLTDAELDLLRGYVEHMAAGARDDAGWSADARGDYNSARALLRKIA